MRSTSFTASIPRGFLRLGRPVVLAALVLGLGSAASLQPCSALASGQNAMVEAWCIFDDGYRVLLKPDDGLPEYCAGANVQWKGNDVYVSIVRAPRGQTVDVSNPSWLSSNGRRYLFISFKHVEPGTWIHEYAADGGPMSIVGGLQVPDHSATTAIAPH